MLKAFLLGLFILGSCIDGFSNNNDKTKEHDPHKPIQSRHVLLGFFGTTHIQQTGINMPTFGIEYGHKIIDQFFVGALVEYEAGQHIVQKQEKTGEDIDVTRSQALLIIPTISYSFHHLIILTAGYGIELEESENLPLFKVGISAELQLKNPRWYAVPNVSWDHTRLFDGLVYGFSLAYTF